MLDSLFAPKNASDTDPTSGFWYGPVGAKAASGISVTPDTALTYSACWAATRLLCGTSAGLPLKLIQLVNSKRQYITDHSAIQAMQNPNEESLGILFRASMMNHQINRGNGYAEIERTYGDGIYALHPIHASRVRVGRDEQDKLTYFVRNNDMSETPLEPKDILHWRSAMSHDGVCGLGVVSHARESIGLGVATERHGAAYFGNGAEPRVVLKHPTKMEKEARDNLRREWNAIHGGPGNNGKVGVLWEGMTIEKLPFSPEDSQFIETRQHNVEEIARWYGVPPHMIQHLLRSTNNNIENQGIDFVKYSLMPWLQLQEAELNRKLLTKEERRKGFYFKIIVEGLLRGDSAARASFYKTQFEMAALSTNDICELEDRDGIGPDGDKRFVSANLIPLNLAGLPKPKSPLDPVIVDEDEDEAVDEDVATVTTPSVSTEAVANRWLSETMQRLMKKEANEAKRAAKTHPQLMAWLDKFYGNYAITLVEAVSQPLAVLGADADAFADAHICQSRQSLLVAAECEPSELEASVLACVEKWNDRYQGELVNGK